MNSMNEQNIVTYELDLANGKLIWSDGLHTVYGYAQAEPADTHEWWSNHIHPDDAMILNEAMDNLMDPTINGWTVEYRFRAADNSYVLVRDSAKVIRDKSGTALQLEGSLTMLQAKDSPIRL